jgi:hypothetical protein
MILNKPNSVFDEDEESGSLTRGTNFSRDSTSFSDRHKLSTSDTAHGYILYSYLNDTADYYTFKPGDGRFELIVTTEGISNRSSETIDIKIIDLNGIEYSNVTRFNPDPFTTSVTFSTSDSFTYLARISPKGGDLRSLSLSYAATLNYLGPAGSNSNQGFLPGYRLTALSNSVNEGEIAEFLLSTTNVASGTKIRYALSNISSNDVLLERSGEFVSANPYELDEGYISIGSDGSGLIRVPIVADNQTEGDDVLHISLGYDESWSGRFTEFGSAKIKINDTSLTTAISYSIGTSTSIVNEGSSVIFSLSTTNLPAGSTVPYTISGVSEADVVGGLLSGSVIIGSDGKSSVTVKIAEDGLTEGSEAVVLNVKGQVAAVTIKDTSVTPLISEYDLKPNSNGFISEDQIAEFILVTKNVAIGTVVPYLISGVSASDIVSGQLSGSTVIGSDGRASIQIKLVPDLFTEGNENLTVTAAGKSASVTVLDTSTSIIQPTYRLTTAGKTFKEGSEVNFSLATTNVSLGTDVTYEISGIEKNDVVGNSLIGSVKVGSDGTATISIALASDQTAEGTETLQLKVADQVISITIEDSFISTNKQSEKPITTKGQKDFFRATEKIELFDGGEGLDSLKISSDFLPIARSGNELVINDDRLLNIERVEFNDVSVAFDLDGPVSAGGIYRLYKATFNRQPDVGGLGFWIAKADTLTKDAVSMAEDFTWSAEFQKLYGIKTIDNYGTGTDVRALVTGFYTNVLGRNPDQGGLDFYAGVIKSKERTVGRVLAEISDSQENYQSTIGLIGNGIVFDPWE